MENKSNVKSAMEYIRSNPEAVFGYRDIRGVENAFRGLLEIFSQEAAKGHTDNIGVWCLDDNFYAIKAEGDRCLDIGDCSLTNDRWKLIFARFCPEVEDYNEFLFGGADGGEPGVGYTDPGENPQMLACNQFVCKHMHVRVKSPGDEKSRKIGFKNGLISLLPVEVSTVNGIVGTEIGFSYDEKVFDDIALSQDFIKQLLDEAARANKGVKYTLLEKAEGYDVMLPIETYCYDE